MLGSLKDLQNFEGPSSAQEISLNNAHVLIKAWHRAASEFTQGQTDFYQFVRDSVNVHRLIQKHVGSTFTSEYVGENIDVKKWEARGFTIESMFNLAHTAAISKASASSSDFDSALETGAIHVLKDTARLYCENLLFSQRSLFPSNSFSYDMMLYTYEMKRLAEAFGVPRREARFDTLDQKVSRRIHDIRRERKFLQVRI